ncbi:glycosyltransferase family 2 protein [Roseobacter sp. SK209-2-6]|uniref:glycosyltransferase family 2 protein n=1 Tax=Roseobacter sp. SK209-2-6 TaxID=388739 RepID=UPI00055DD6E0|nr:glycosyltransferase family 2 protein [Roseobacter sp. SK209-2-6]
MMYRSLDDFLNNADQILSKGPIALIFVEDDVEIATTLRHHLQCGFEAVIALMPDAFDLPKDIKQKIHRVPFDSAQSEAVFDAVNRISSAANPGCWIYYCYNAEFLFYPFCETRTVKEMLGFHAEERRSAMLTYVIDLYAGDLSKHPNAVSLESAFLDKSGYYAQSRWDDASNGPHERQLDFFGGVRWRHEEHIPWSSRKIDRIALFQAKQGLTLQADHTFDDQEYNTYSCPWHHNLTATICSFRTAKALKINPGSSDAISSFKWHNSTPFEWHSRQLLDLGLMEPGQWF